MELWDAYDRNFKKIEGITLIRGEESSIPKGIYHMVVLILVRHVDGQYLLMRRSPGKAYPLYWEATAGGSVLQGESAIEGALRELREETGIIADTLEEKERFVKDETHSAYYLYASRVVTRKALFFRKGRPVTISGLIRKKYLPWETMSYWHRP